MTAYVKFQEDFKNHFVGLKKKKKYPRNEGWLKIFAFYTIFNSFKRTRTMLLCKYTHSLHTATWANNYKKPVSGAPS